MMENALQNKTHHILIVDDNEDDHFLLNRAILKVIPDADIKSVFDGEEAVEYLFKGSVIPDLIFLDLHMEKLSGSFTVNLLRKNKKLSKIPIIILTGSSSLADRLILKIKLKANEFFTKPICNEELVEIIHQVKKKWLV